MRQAASNPHHCDDVLIAKYDVPAPRYTSYPTALQFDPRFTAANYAALWDKPATIAPLSLYVHIPFCNNICYYCACNKIVTRDADAAPRYLSYLEREIALQSKLVGKKRPVRQMHWGGGTPTFLKPAELTQLMYAISRHFRLVDDSSREYSIEIDPRTVVAKDLALLKGLGFNRLSFGVQDLDERVLAAVNRCQSPQRLVELYDAARDYSFASISMDLIYGLPHQTTASLRQTFEQIVKLQPDRIALYNYAHLPARFPSQRPLDRLPRPPAQEKLSMLALAFELFGAAGYIHIGMDHFVRSDDSLAMAQAKGTLQRNFQGYSTCLAPDLVGLGVSAIGSTVAGYAQNHRELSAYCDSLDRGELPIGCGLELDVDDSIRRYVIAQLICNLHLDIDTIEQRFGIRFDIYFSKELSRLEDLAADRLIERRGRQLDVTEAGRPFLRNICMVFDRYLSRADAQALSKTL